MGEESNVSYLQLPTRNIQEDNRLCTRCGEMGHWKRFCKVTAWCKFCTRDMHSTKACRKYANFVKDNPIASSRRPTPVQEQRRSVQPEPANANIQSHQQETDQRQLFPHPPTQCFTTSGNKEHTTTLTTMTVSPAKKQSRCLNGPSFSTVSSTVFTISAADAETIAVPSRRE